MVDFYMIFNFFLMAREKRKEEEGRQEKWQRGKENREWKPGVGSSRL